MPGRPMVNQLNATPANWSHRSVLTSIRTHNAQGRVNRTLRMIRDAALGMELAPRQVHHLCSLPFKNRKKLRMGNLSSLLLLR
jgi:hypothetical protein